MPVAIVGMHRSGTSLVAQALAKAGLYLGAEDELIPAAADNADGYWEHAAINRLNEAVLAELGGGWDSPPGVPGGWGGEPRLAALAAQARQILAGFEGHEPWGWKDPRTSLTLPLWLELVPDLKLVLCVRNPLEVALSLNRRGMFSYTQSLRLWQAYNESVLAASTPAQRIVTDYGAYFARPKAELRRVAAFAGLATSGPAFEDAAASARADLRHTRFELADLVDARVAADVVDLYAWLLAQAGARGKAAATPPPPAQLGAARLVDDSAVEVKLLRAKLAEAKESLDRQQAALDEQLQGLAQQQDGIAELEAALERARRREAELAQEVEILRARVEGEERVQRQLDRLQESFHVLEATLTEPEPVDERAAAYAKQVQRIRQVVRSETPPASTVAVVSRGDEHLVGLYGRVGTHFPQTERGGYAGGNPASDLAAVAHLEAARANGADYFLVPADHLWWLEHYAGLRRHLATTYRRVRWDVDTCALFALREPAERETHWRRETVELSAAVRSALGRVPTVVDWGTGLDLANMLPAIQVPARPGGSLPYEDASVDIVAVPVSGPDALAEAERVAAAAVIAFPVGSANGATPDVRLKFPESPLAPAGVSIVVPVVRGARAASCLDSLARTLPRGFAGDIVLVDDVCDRATSELLYGFAAAQPQARVVHTDGGVGALAAANRGAEEAGEEIVVFVGDDVVLLPDWLRPLVHTLAQHEDAGAAGGRLLFPSGALEQAGGAVFRDGSALRIGYGHANPEDGLFDYVRPVDFCSRLLLATRRRAFLELGGFDAGLGDGSHADLDYGLRLQVRELRVYYQPESNGVHLAVWAPDARRDGAVEAAGPRFTRRWRPALKARPVQPAHLDLGALHALAAET